MGWVVGGRGWLTTAPVGTRGTTYFLHDTVPLRVVFFTSLSRSVQSLSKSLANLFSIFYLTMKITNNYSTALTVIVIPKVHC